MQCENYLMFHLWLAYTSGSKRVIAKLFAGLVGAKLVSFYVSSAYSPSDAIFSSWWSTTPTVYTSLQSSDDGGKCI